MFSKLLCKLGFHEFTWLHSDVTDEEGKLKPQYRYKKSPPDLAKCKHCGVKHG